MASGPKVAMGSQLTDKKMGIFLEVCRRVEIAFKVYLCQIVYLVAPLQKLG